MILAEKEPVVVKVVAPVVVASVVVKPMGRKHCQEAAPRRPKDLPTWLDSVVSTCSIRLPSLRRLCLF